MGQRAQQHQHLLGCKAFFAALAHAQSLLVTLERRFHATSALIVEGDIGQHYRCRIIEQREGLVGVLPGLGAFLLISCSEFGATAHDDAHHAFMTLPPYTRTREGETRQLGRGPKPCRLDLCVRTCPQMI